MMFPPPIFGVTLQEFFVLSKDEIEANDARKFETVAVPEWGGEVCVRSLTEEEYDDFQDALYHRVSGKKGLEFNLKVVRRALAAACICDGDLNPVFTADELKTKSAAAISRIVEVAKRLCGMTTEDEEDLAKNSGTAPGGGSSSV